MNLTVTLILAVLLDYWLGEPKKHHPLVFFGNLAEAVEKKLNKQYVSAGKQKTRGLVALFLLLFPLTIIIYLLLHQSLINDILAPVILYFCIAAKSLGQHANAVLLALEADNLNRAKKQVAMIVSRETEHMTADDVRKATIESVLENGADAVFAPIFWFIIAGPAGAVLYRLSNTLDAMWGYKNQQYFYFGWAAARFDDLLNWIPARLTALSYALLGQTAIAINCWRKQAYLLESPNAGPVMTAGAGALNLTLGGSAWYHGKRKDKVFFGGQNCPVNYDVHRACRLINSGIILWILIVFIVQFFGDKLA